MASGGIEVARAYVTIVPSMEGSQKAISQELGVAVDKEGSKAGKSLGQKLLDGTGSILKTGGKILGGLAVTAATTAVAGVAAITKQALSSFKDYEQLTGGVEKLFGDTASTVMDNASRAFATAGLDANQYMEQVTSVAASLISSLEGDTEAAAQAADMAIQDMSDNANVFGTDIQSIQNAYSGFAKGNYSMLDNLKLGYQGTKDEMQRLLEDAEELSGMHYELGNYADMVEAVHVIQTEMNITGTTAAEALGTIEGSMNMTKGAWSNFVTALAGGGDITQALDGLKTAIFGVEGASNGLANNVLPVIERTVNSIIDVFPEIISSLLPTVISTIQSIIPKIITLTGQLIQVLTNAIDQLFGDGFDALINDVVAAIPQLITSLLNAIPTLLNATTKIITSVLNALITNLPAILKAITDSIPKIIQALLASLTTIVDALADAIPELLNGIIDAAIVIVDMLPQIIDSILEALPKFYNKLYGKLLSGLPAILDGIVILVQGIVQALPQIIQSIVEFIPELITSILDAILGNLGAIIEGLVNVVMALVTALPEIITALVDAIPDIIMGIMSAVLDALPTIIEALISLVGQIITNLPTILVALGTALFEALKLLLWDIPRMLGEELIPQIIEAIGNILVVIGDALKSAKDALADWIGGVFDSIKSFFSDIFDTVKEKLTSIFDKVKEVFTNIFNAVKEKLTSIFDKVKDVFTKIYNAIKTPIENAKNTISTVINAMKTTISNVFNSIYTTVSNIFNRIKTAITGPIDTAKSLVSNAINAMKNIFNNAGFSLPKIKLPHFSIKGSLSISPPSVPKLSIDWYDKGYDEAQILKGSTIFGLGANGNLLAGGERGNEVVVGEQHLLDMISSVVNPAPIVVNVYGAEGQDEELLAQKVMEKIQELTNNKEVVYA